MAVRIQCPHCATSYMVMNGVEKQRNICPRCRKTFQLGSRNVPPAAAPPATGATPGRAPLRQPVLGYLMIFGAWVIGPGTVFGVYALNSRADWGELPVFILILVIGTALAGWMLIRGRRLVAQHADDVMATDPRPPVLLLRSFEDDELELERPHRTMFGSYVVTFEESLAEVCQWYGPIIAIGRPGEALPPLGAARLWVDHNSWQQKVAELLGDCGVVVMIMGAIKGKDGLAWEVETIARLGLLKKLVLVVPPLTDEAHVKTRWLSYQRLIQGRVPPYQGGETLLTFDASGRCDVDRRGGGYRDRKSYQTSLHAALPRLCGKPRRPLAVTVSRAAASIAFGVIVAVLFIGMTIWKAEADREEREEQQRWQRELYSPPPYTPR